MNRAERHVLQHVRQIRAELQDDLTPRRTFAALRARILKRLDRIEANLTELIDEPELIDEQPVNDG